MKLRKISNASIIAALVALAPMALYSCTGDTDGGGQGQDAKDSDSYVDNGGSGAKLELEIEASDNIVGVGEQVPFRVRMTDPNGAPLQFARVFCDTEQGVAIIEPSANGIAVESTNVNGYMSGFIGGVTPGSYLMECRSQTGFNLVDRVSVRVTGTVPAGFQGFPGAAGGNLGGGRIIDQTPDVGDGNGVRITAVTVTDVGTSSGIPSGPLDIARNGCYVTTPASGSTPAQTTCTAEPFVFNNFSLSLRNNTNTNVFINTVEIRRGSTTVVSAQGVPVEIAKAGGVGTVSGTLTTNVNCTETKCFNTGGTNNLTILPGTRNYTFIVTGVSEAGESFEVTRTAAIQFDYVNNCTTGTAGAVCP